MGKIPVRFKVYDNGWKYGIYIGATIGGSGILSALPGILAPDEYVFSREALIWGIIGLVIFLISKFLNIESAKKGNY
jgi:hypothetical protein